MSTQIESNTYSVNILMEQARSLAANYRKTTGKTLAGVSGELAVYDAIRLLKLQSVEDNLPYRCHKFHTADIHHSLILKPHYPNALKL